VAEHRTVVARQQNLPARGPPAAVFSVP